MTEPITEDDIRRAWEILRENNRPRPSNEVWLVSPTPLTHEDVLKGPPFAIPIDLLLEDTDEALD